MDSHVICSHCMLSYLLGLWLLYVIFIYYLQSCLFQSLLGAQKVVLSYVFPRTWNQTWWYCYYPKQWPVKLQAVLRSNARPGEVMPEQRPGSTHPKRWSRSMWGLLFTWISIIVDEEYQRVPTRLGFIFRFEILYCFRYVNRLGQFC